MRKVQLFLMLFFLSNLVLFAQTVPSLSGSTIECSDEYVPGTTMDLIFQMSLNSNGNELPDSVAITLPAGLTVNYASNPMPGSSLVMNSISGNTVSWGTNSNSGSSYPLIQTPTNGFNSFTAGQGAYLCSHNGCMTGQYYDNLTGYTVIYADPSFSTHIKGNYETESCCDQIRIYDGEGTMGTILWEAAGLGTIDFTGQPGQILTLSFTSDGSVTYPGFSFFVTNEQLYREVSVNVTIESNAVGDKIIPWHISGNMGSGSEHDLNGTIVLKREPIAFNLLSTTPDCGVNNGTITAEVLSGAVEPFSFLWNDPSNSTTATISNLGSGFYTVTVTDATGFTGVANAELSNTNGPVILTNITKQPCFGAADGSAYVSVTSGIPTYIYLWSDNTTDSVLTNAAAGFYSVTVTDGDNCKTIGSVTLIQPQYPVTVSIFKTDIPCANSTSGGSVWVEASGGVPSYSYNWDNDSYFGDNWYQPGAGLHTVVITDASSCQTTESITVGQAPALEVTFTNTNPKCYGGTDGTSFAQISGGTPGYSFSWSTGTSTPAISNLNAGTYYYYVTDNNNCNETFSTIITNNDALNVLVDSVNPSCGNADGSITLTVQGGVYPYTYNWENLPGVTGTFASDLDYGTYQVTITDANMCSLVEQVALNSSTAPEIVISKTEPLCFGDLTGKAWVTVINPVGTYAYSWSNAATEDTIKNVPAGDYYITVTDENLCSVVQLIKISEPSVLNVELYKNDIYCNNGTNSGSMWISVSGGTPGYSNLWSNNETGAGIYSLSEGTYSITVTDTLGCQTVKSENIILPEVLNVTYVLTQPTCYDSYTGMIDVTVTGGTAPYEYYWNGPSSGYTEDLQNAIAGEYYLEVYDYNGCTEYRTIILDNPEYIGFEVLSTSSPLCGNTSDGEVFVSAYGGTGSYTYYWENVDNSSINGITADLIDIPAGEYSYKVTDALACEYNENIYLEGVPDIYLGFSTIQASCQLANGMVSVSPTNGTAPYSFIWSNLVEDDTIDMVGVGVYTVTVTDAIGCQMIGSVAVSNPSEYILIDNITHVSCNGVSDGEIMVSAGGMAKAGLTYLWSNGATTEMISNLEAGTYTLTFTDDFNCVKIQSYTVNEPDPITYSIDSVNVACFGENSGSISIPNVWGGTPGSGGQGTNKGSDWIYENNSAPKANFGYYIVWNDYNTSFDRWGLAAGTYTFTITDENSCEKTGSVTITEPLPIIYESADVTHVSCYNEENGSITINASGGDGPLSYSLDSEGWQESNVFENLWPGIYDIYVTTGSVFIGGEKSKANASFCPQYFGTVEIFGPQSELQAAAVPVNVTCYGGNSGYITFYASGGTPPYSYSVDGGATFSSSDVVSGLTAGNYSLVVKDANECTQSIGNATILQPQDITISFSQISAVLCYGENTAGVSAWISGGTGTMNYLWSDNSTDYSLFNIGAGTYTITVTDENSCTKTDSYVVTQPDQIVITPIVSDVLCYGQSDGSIILNVTGGTPDYYYSIDGGISFVQINSFDYLAPNTYMPVVKDINNCMVTATDIVITEPAVLTTTTQTTNVLCYGAATGTASAMPVGGIYPYTYQWTPAASDSALTSLVAGSYSLTVTDYNGCIAFATAAITQPLTDFLIDSVKTTNVSCFDAGDGTAMIYTSGGTYYLEYSIDGGLTWSASQYTGLIAGTYSPSVRDANGCIVTDADVIISEPATLAVTVTSANISCYQAEDGMINASVTGGTTPFVYDIGTIPQETGLFEYLPAASYTLTVTDANGCQAQELVVLTEPSELTATTLTTNVLCYGASTGTASAMPVGGTYPYTYLWAPAASDSALTGLPAGSYSLTVTDFNGCIAFATAAITQPLTDFLIDSVTTTNISCFDAGDGAAMIYTSGGTGSLEYSIDGGLTWSASQYTGLIDGTYSPSVKDANGCIVTDTDVIITEPDALVVTVTSGNISCYQAEDGMINATVTGGTIPYVYDIGTIPQETGLFEYLPAASYTLTVTDANGCQAQELVELTEPSELTLTTQTTNVLCYGYSSGTASAMPAGGTYPYTYQWTAPATSDSALTGLAAGIYSLTVTDYNGCMAYANAEITQPLTDFLIDSVVVTNALCNGASDGAITVYSSGGAPPITYQISQTLNNTTGIFTGLIADTYTPEITDANGCVVTGAAVVLSEPAVLTLSLAVTDAICFGAANGVIIATAGGGTLDYTFNIGLGAQTGNVFTDLAAGTYSVTVIDANSCEIVETAEVLQPDELTASISVTNVSCYGLCDGTAIISVQGGVSPYTYTWFDNSSQSSLTGICAGTLYAVSVTDFNGCIFPLTFSVTQPDTLTITVTATTSACNICDGTATVTATGGTLTYTYLWSDNQTTGTASNLCGGYLVTVTVTDENNCTASMDIVVPGLANSTLSGTVVYSGGVFPDNAANAELYKIINVTEAELIYTQPVTAAAFAFQDVEFGEYLLKINVTDNSTIPTVLSTYLDSVVTWEESQPINVDCDNTYNFNVHMFEVTMPVGVPTGSFSGYITLGDFGGKGSFAMQGEKLVGEPVPGAEIYVELEPDDEPIINTTSNDTGYYEVSGLPEGNTYSMKVDIPGLPLMSTYQNITIGGSDTVFTNLNFYVDTSSTDGAIFINTNISVAVNEKKEFSFTIYPNPFIEFITVDYSLPADAHVKLELYDLNGKAVAVLMNGKQTSGSHEMQYETKQFGLADGTYLLRLQIDNNVYLKKISCIR